MNRAVHLEGGVTVLLLRRRKGYSLICLLDTNDYDKVKAYTWYASMSGTTYYAHVNVYRNGKFKKISMHTLLLPCPTHVDHKDGVGWDNRRNNLRRATFTQNQRNQAGHRNSASKYKGVWPHSAKWQAGIQINKNKRLYLGTFQTEKEAALAYNAAATEYFGEFARLNVITA